MAQGEDRRPYPGPVAAGSTRAVFEELIEEALSEVDARPSRRARSYLVGLLEERVRAPRPARGGEPMLGEALLRARLDRSAARIRRLRELGDRALFAAGVFGDSFSRKLVDLDYVGDIGRAAYGDLSSALIRSSAEAAHLFRELAEEFRVFVDLLAEVGDRTRQSREADLLRIYDRFVATGSPRDRRRLARAGVAPVPAPGPRGRWQ